MAVLAVGCGGATDGNGDAANAAGSGGAAASAAATNTATSAASLTSSTTGVHVDSSCSGVVCDDPVPCGSDRTHSRPDGACCAGCIPNEPAACPEIACPLNFTCPKGYVRGDLMGGCCGECLPDPLYCDVDYDCVLADRPHSCCGCPEVISRRALQDDACWSPVSEPRPIPDECYPDATCDRECEACPETPSAVCHQKRCIALHVQQ